MKSSFIFVTKYRHLYLRLCKRLDFLVQSCDSNLLFVCCGKILKTSAGFSSLANVLTFEVQCL